MEKKKITTTWLWGWTNTLLIFSYSFWKCSQEACFEIAFLNAMGFRSFNHVMNIYFFSVYLLLVEIEWWTFPLMPLSMFIFSLLQSALLSDNAKQVMFGLIHISNPSFKDFSSVTIIPTKIQNKKWQNDQFFLYFGIFFFEWQSGRTQFSR